MWFSSQLLLKDRVIDPKIVRGSGKKELLEKLEFQKWTHLFLLSDPVIHG